MVRTSNSAWTTIEQFFSHIMLMSVDELELAATTSDR
jgi:hypothetical protein